LLERTLFFRWSDPGVLRALHKWTIGLHGDRGGQSPATTCKGATEQLWLELVDRPGILRVTDVAQARQFAHEAADHFRDVITVRCSGRSLPLIAGEIALGIGVMLRGTFEEAYQQLAASLADARVLLLLEGMNSNAPFVQEGQASVLYAPSAGSDPAPSVHQMAEAFVHWPSRSTECAGYIASVEGAIEGAEWNEAALLGRAAFAFLRAHQRLFEAAHTAQLLQRRADHLGDEEVSLWAREELSWIIGGERVRAARASAEQMTLHFA
jgi:hypothetical protein